MWHPLYFIQDSETETVPQPSRQRGRPKKRGPRKQPLTIETMHSKKNEKALKLLTVHQLVSINS